MARYRPYDPQQTKMIALCYAQQLLPGTFEHALSYLIDNELDCEPFAARFENDETGAPVYDPAVLLKVVLFAYLGLIEPAFEHIQQRGLDQFTLRGQTKVDTQWKLICIVHNIAKLQLYGKLAA